MAERGQASDAAGDARRASDRGPRHGTVPLGRLREGVFQITRGQGVAYVTDAADHVAIRAEIVRLAAGADHLFIATAFLHSDRTLAEATR